MKEKPNPDQRVAEYGTTRIPYQVVRRERNTLSIEVLPDGTVQAVAPLDTREEEIRWRLEKRGAWILRQQRELALLPPPLPPRKYVSGETHRYLGRQHRLRVLIGREEEVRVTRGELLVTAKAPERAERVLQAWLRERAEQVLAERMVVCQEKASHHGIRYSGEFRLRRMTTRWGSCSRAGRLTFNPLLIQAPKECIDYVLLHELCHTTEFSHSRAYYVLLGRVLPDWKAKRARLNRLVELPDPLL
ncbi:M48 family metallopeptidase [Deinococcus aquatilis]|uniref:M48 family metallopeptidase n=1 Tax=Deinococcus aquatilis TaxID=519440 RepID=UPI00035E6AFD|nr:SprT family zinc-dependent metalloprotease [Deinococcus aquatilis]